jgi:hypothetical protein
MNLCDGLDLQQGEKCAADLQEKVPVKIFLA